MGPISFLPLFMDRVWGGRKLEELFGKPLPPGVPIGESWEIVDRPEAQSIAHDGTTLHELWTTRRSEIFGARAARCGERFPLLVKLLDAREALSVQVHPPPSVAARLGGEPKSEAWYVAHADPGAHLLVGLRAGVTRDAFETALTSGEDVSRLLHRIDVQRGDAIYLPAGRVHAIGPGCVIVEVQQNSDTTYRVYDYGRPRELHVAEAMAAIDWDDFEPPLLPGPEVATEHFTISRRLPDAGECAIVCDLSDGEFFLLPADAEDRAVDGDVLVIELPA